PKFKMGHFRIKFLKTNAEPFLEKLIKIRVNFKHMSDEEIKVKEKRKTLFTDERRCTGCRTCELACAFYHYKEKNPSRSLIRIVKLENKLRDVPVVCRHCEKAPCMEVCPVSAISRNKDTGAVVIDQEICIGCKACVEACPFSIIIVDPKTNKVTKCDLCDGNPRCAMVCPMGAVFFARQDVGPRILARNRLEKKILEKP
ncbi:MAG: 4Fe-4S dicluster domain-containing protein, partial [Candidatus Hadarchaeaceae archaeon]